MRLLFLLLIVNFLSANTIKYTLDKFYPRTDTIKFTKGTLNIDIPITNRWVVKKGILHLEYTPSKNLVKQRSSIIVLLNGVVLFKRRLDPDIDIYKEDIILPVSLLDKFNKLKIVAIQHYCMNCCENEASPELWTKINLKSSYLKLIYREKNVENNILFYSKSILDKKKFTPFKFGILVQNKNDFYINLASKLSTYLGSVLEYRNLYINSINKIRFDEDIFVIGSKRFVSTLLYLNNQNIPDVFVVRNPLNPLKSIIVISGDQENLEVVLDSFISIKPKYLVSKTLNIESVKLPAFKAYDSPRFIPVEKKVYLSDLGYKDLKLFYPYSYYDIKFTVPPDIFKFGKSYLKFHLFYNYGQGARKDSVINIFINDKFLTSFKIEKEYGSLLEDKELEIPFYMLNRGENKLRVDYAFMPPGEGFCVAKNYKTLQGTIFADKTYIEIPSFLHWVEMPYLEYFTSLAYPYSIYPDLSNTQVFITSNDNKTLSSLYTLLGFMGEKVSIPGLNLKVTTDINNIDKDAHLLVLGKNIPSIFYKNTPIEINDGHIELRLSIIKKIQNLIERKLLGESYKLKTILDLANYLDNRVIITQSQSPFNSNKVVTIFTSNSLTLLNKSIQSLYDAKFVSKIKGDLAIVDKDLDIVSIKVGDSFYMGHLPWINYLLFRFGFNPILVITISLILIIILVFIVKKLIDYRYRKILFKKDKEEKDSK